MAIVRTTPKETGTTGTAPPTAPAVGARPSGANLQRPGVSGRGLAQRAPGQRTVAPAQSGNAGQFFSDMRTELRRVVWPTREEVRAGAIVTIGLLIFFALYIFGLEFIAERLLAPLFQQ